ncbi:hypothetical protein [Brachybacterium fresconis]|uniref:Outer membrane biosynthesis protein TonB n=1 Tax=Brachybacterium fresconis TaxID=173363 RepID=A0ABS4YMW2_9MICO|nr:hypothetical protein [Brachybacterium fresconis]MBP2410136.1 outer membrane biosynthesis protein TonB [Brachybacterium fresconis]
MPEPTPEPAPRPTPEPAPRPTPQPAPPPTPPPRDEPASLGVPTPQTASADASDAPRTLDLVRARFPHTPDQDASGLAAHAERLAALRRRVDLAALRGRQSALTFDPRNGAS